MMGQQSGGHKQLFYSFNLDDHIPSDHLLRGIDQFLDLGDLRQHLAPFYSHTGRLWVANCQSGGNWCLEQTAAMLPPGVTTKRGRSR